MAADAACITTADAACRRTTQLIVHTTVVTLRMRTEAIEHATVVPAHPWTSPQAYGFISATTLDRGTITGTMMMMIKRCVRRN